MIKVNNISNGFIRPLKHSPIKEIETTGVKAIEEQLSPTNIGVLQAYQGIRTSTHRSFEEFEATFNKKLEEFKDIIPKPLYIKIQEASKKHNYSLQKVLSDYYSGLNDCKSLADVKKRYPDIQLPDLNFEKEISEEIKYATPKQVCEKLHTLKTREEKIQYLQDYYKKITAKNFEAWDIYPEQYNKIQKETINEIIDTNYVGRNFSQSPRLFNSKMPMKYLFMTFPDRESAYIDLLKEVFVNGKSLNSASITTPNGKIISSKVIRRDGIFPTLDNYFKVFIQKNEKSAEQFNKAANFKNKDFRTPILEQSLKSSELISDLEKATDTDSSWPQIKSIWKKVHNSNNSSITSDDLVDAFLIPYFRKNKPISGSNPLEKYRESERLNKTQINILNKLYKRCQKYDIEKFRTPSYLKFKSQFDIENMKKSIELIEKRYMTRFVNNFWSTDARKNKIINKISEITDLDKTNIKLSDTILDEIIDIAFA